MPLPASIRSLKAQLRTLSQPDFWSPVLGLLLLMPLGWQIVNHFQQPSPVVKTPTPPSDANATESIDSESGTEESATTADIENSAVLEQLLDRGVQLDGGVQPNSSVSAPPTSFPTTANASETFDRSARGQLDANIILDQFSSSRTASATTPATTPANINGNPSAISYVSRSSIAQDILLAPYSANNNATPRSALQNAFLENSVPEETTQVPTTPQPVDVKENLALVEPPSPPAPSTLKLPTSPPVPLNPLPSSTPSTSLLPLPSSPIPASSVEEPIIPPAPNTLPTSLNPSLNPTPNSTLNPIPNPIPNSIPNPIPNSTPNPIPNSTLNPIPNPIPNPTPNSTQQTKLYPYVPERVYSSPLPALPPSVTGTNLNSNGLPPLPNAPINPQSQNPPTNPTAAEPISPTGNSEIELQAVPFSVERLIGGGEINTFANP